MTSVRVLFLLGTLVAALLPAVRAAEPAAPLTLTRAFTHRLTSSAVGDTFVIQVRLPEKYEPATKRYPVLYVLDGDFWFGAASDIATYLTMVDESPAMIVVGIAYGGTRDDWWQKRARDYVPAPLHSPPPKEFPLAGGAERFQQFLATELFTFVEQNYAARPDDRTLVGLSFGGTFATYTLFTRPELFQGYIILAPGLGGDKRRFFEMETAFHAAHPRLPATVFFAIGDQDKPGMVGNWRKFDEQVIAHHYEDLRWTSLLLPAETHISVYPVGLTRGLKTIHPPATPAAAPAQPSSAVGQAETAPPDAGLRLSRAHEHRLTSQAVGDSFVIQVRLPENSTPQATRYPVLYVLDADYWFGAASDTAAYLTMMQESPAMIVVGIAYGGSRRDWFQKRARDYTPKPRFDDDRAKLPLAGHADQFQQFLTAELFPFIEKTYAARADDRTLAGYSLGGLFALHTLFTRAELFQNYIILAPAVDWDRKQILETEAAFHARNTRLPATVFNTHGDQDPLQNHAEWQVFDQLVASRGYEGLRWISHLFPGETHVSIYPVGLARGLRTIHATGAAVVPSRP